MFESLTRHYSSPIILAPTLQGLRIQHHELERDKVNISEALLAVLRCMSLVEEQIQKKEKNMEAALNVVKAIGKDRLKEVLIEVIPDILPAAIDLVWDKLDAKTDAEVAG